MKTNHVLLTKKKCESQYVLYEMMSLDFTAKNGHWLNCILSRINKILKKIYINSLEYVYITSRDTVL